jgi:hypothetical protein
MALEDMRRVRRRWWAICAWLGELVPVLDPQPEVEGGGFYMLAPGDADAWERLSWLHIEWSLERWMGDKWCGAWASLCDAVNGGPSAVYNEIMASSCDRRCGRGPDPERVYKGRKDEYQTHQVSELATANGWGDGCVRPGDIITVRGDEWGAHVTIVVRVAEGGAICIGGNQTGVRVDGRPVRGGVAATLYPWADLRRIIRIPDREYDPALAYEVTEAMALEAVAAFDARWWPPSPAAPASPASAPSVTWPAPRWEEVA